MSFSEYFITDIFYPSRLIWLNFELQRTIYKFIFPDLEHDLVFGYLLLYFLFLYLQDLHRQFPLMKISFSAIAQQCQWRCGHPQKMDKARCFVWWLPFCGSIVQHPYVKHRNLGHFFCDGVHSNPLGNYVFRK